MRMIILHTSVKSGKRSISITYTTTPVYLFFEAKEECTIFGQQESWDLGYFLVQTLWIYKYLSHARIIRPNKTDDSSAAGR